MGINIEIVSPQNEPGYDQNYPSCLWDKRHLHGLHRQVPGPGHEAPRRQDHARLRCRTPATITGTTSTSRTRCWPTATAKAFLLGRRRAVGRARQGDPAARRSRAFPIWATEHKCGNYPWITSAQAGLLPVAAYNSYEAPNDQAYARESWDYIRDAINKGKVTSYSAWNMVLDRVGLGNDTSRDWRQDALLVGERRHGHRDAGLLRLPSPVAVHGAGRHGRHHDRRRRRRVQEPGRQHRGRRCTTAARRTAPTWSRLAARSSQFAMPAQGWATVKYKP